MVLKWWDYRLNLWKESLIKFPRWAKFFNVPFEYWNEQGLSHIASIMQIPAESQKRITFAKICVEIEVGSELVENFHLDNRNENFEGVKVCQWVLNQSLVYAVLRNDWRKKPKVEWRHVQKPQGRPQPMMIIMPKMWAKMT